MTIILRFISIYIVLLLLFSLSVVLSHSIPYSWIADNVEASLRQTEGEGDYPENLNTYIFRIDNYTDGGVMLNTAKNADYKNPVESAMLMRVGGEGTGYGRYWHGYQVFLRPLLIFFDIVKIRCLNYALFLLLIAYSSLLMLKSLSKGVALSWLATLLIINFHIVPHCMQFSCCFYIAIISMIVILKFDKLTESTQRALCLFFIIGSLTSFFDLLTTPTVTLGLPLAILLLKNGKQKTHIKQIVCLSLSWGIGYVFLWMSKWGVEYLLTGVNIFEEAKTQVEYRLGGDMGDAYSNLLRIVYSFSMSLSACILFVSWLFWKYCNKNALLKNSYLLIIAMIPFFWFIVVHQHSITHFLFTWRSFTVSIFCIFVYISKTISMNRLVNSTFEKL